jgi:hypothetical protein
MKFADQNLHLPNIPILSQSFMRGTYSRIPNLRLHQVGLKAKKLSLESQNFTLGTCMGKIGQNQYN